MPKPDKVQRTKAEYATTFDKPLDEVKDEDVEFWVSELQRDANEELDYVEEDVETETETESTSKPTETETETETQTETETETETESHDDPPPLPEELGDYYMKKVNLENDYVLKSTLSDTHYTKSDVDGGDVVGDVNHPHHKIIADNHAKAQVAETKLATAEAELATLRTSIVSGAGGLNDPEKLIFGGISLESVDEGENTQGDWFRAKAKYETAQSAISARQQEETQKVAAADQAWSQEVAATRKEMEVDDAEAKAINDHHLKKGVSYSNAVVLSRIRVAGGLDKLIEAKAGELAKSKADAVTAEAVRIASEKAGEEPPLTSTDGSKQDTLPKFEQKTAEQINNMPDDEFAVYLKARNAAVVAGDVEELVPADANY